MPTRWLVVRSLSSYDQSSGEYGAPRQASWIVESDYVTPTLRADSHGIVRPAAAVPLRTAPDGAPYMFMGRVVDAADWDPAGERPEDYLPYYTGADGAPLYLTAVGFVGAAFSGYYPDCRSVFGFWDTFADVPDVYALITKNSPIRFRASYTVIGWLPDATDDPLATLAGAVRGEYNAYVAQCADEHVQVASTPADVFARITSDQLGWRFSANAICWTLAADNTLDNLEVPEGTLCAGVTQDVVWDRLDPAAAPFLAAPVAGQPWTDEVQIAVGNTTVQAVSALVKSHLAAPDDGSVLGSYETLLDALQLGLLRDLQGQGNSLATLEQALHAKAFSGVDGGHQWTIQTKAAPGSLASVQLTLPLTLAEQLDQLNTAQLGYDQARARIVLARQQLFMDWFIYVKQLVEPPSGPIVVDTNALSAFLATREGGELHAVTGAATAAGLLRYQREEKTGRIVDVSTTDAASTLAGQVVSAYRTVAAALAALPDGWELDAIPAPPFWQPTDPVLVMEGDRLEPARRNGPTTAIAVRTDSELIGALAIAGASGSWTVPASAVAGLPTPPAALPSATAAAAAAAIAESVLLDPQYAAVIAAAAGAPNPGVLAAAVSAAQGGQSPLDPLQTEGLYGAVRASGYQREPNPAQSVQAPEQLTVTFTNATKTALAPDAVGWNAQTALPEFGRARVDPFLPVWLTWQLQLNPLARGRDGGYDPGTLRDGFNLDADAIDLTYHVPADFTTGVSVIYSGAVVLSKKPFVSLTDQIDRYLADYPHDKADTELGDARDYLAGRKVMSQSLDTFNLMQTLRTTIPQIPVEDLVQVPDPTTDMISGAATAIPADSWYDTGFNALAPISTGLRAQYNFGPLRSGFGEVTRLTIVDTFGQLMNLTTPAPAQAEVLQVTTTNDLSAAQGDMANAGKVYLPPRVLAPARVDAHWLSAAHNVAVPGVTTDFVEVNDHPATSPVCGWIVPNHLDLSLAFYNADGSPIGSFGVEHEANVYRTRAGNTANTRSLLELDIGPRGQPPASMNPHVAQLMWFISDRSSAFLGDLMDTIENSDQFINPASFAQDAALSVLVGRPLAVVRTVQSISTAGGVLPASQANGTDADALYRTVSGGWHDYAVRQANTCAGLDQVKIPVRLGDLTDIDDGLVAFLPEAGPPMRPPRIPWCTRRPRRRSHRTSTTACSGQARTRSS